MEKTVYGKINLSLHVLGKRADGYHELDTVMQTVDVADTLHIEPSAAFRLETDHPHLPTDDSNLCRQAWQQLHVRYNIPRVHMRLTKRIPIGGGMGGGSADAAAGLTALIELFDLCVPEAELHAIARGLGADVPFFLTGGTCRATGIGDVLTPLPSFAGHPLLLIHDGTPMVSAHVYRRGPTISASRIDALLPRLAAGETELPEVHNDLRKPAEALHPPLAQIRDALRDHGADTALLSGAGGTVYGLYSDPAIRDRAYEALRDRYAWVRCAETI